MVEVLNKQFTILMLVVCTIILSGSVVFAANPSFSVSVEPENYRVNPEGFANYTFTINNLRKYDQVVTIQLSPADATNWVLFPNAVSVPGESEENVVVKIFPKTTASLGVYDLTIKVNDNFGNNDYFQLPLHLTLDGFYSDYVPNVALSVSVPQSQDPRSPVKITVLTRNRNQLDISNMSIKITSDLFSEDYSLSLGPRKEKTTDFFFDLNPLQEPGAYPIKISLYYPRSGKTITDSEVSLNIDGYSSITPVYNSSEELFLRTETIFLENLGNEERTKEFSVYAPWPKRLFMYSDPKAERVKIDGKTYLLWTTSLKSTESMTIFVYTNYRVPIILLIILVLGSAAYFIFRSPILILKEAAVVGEDSEGISEIKIRIFIKNRSNGSVNNISVTDKLPGITELIHSNHLGSMKPTRITKTQKKGTLLYWDIDGLDSYEERIITYRLKAKLKIIGDMTLPRARVKFDVGSGRERASLSPVPLFIRK